jgi:hypothetical protein
MTERQIALIRALAECSFLPASFDKRFARRLRMLANDKPGATLSKAQHATLLGLIHRYRRQLSTTIIEAARDEAETQSEALQNG